MVDYNQLGRKWIGVDNSSEAIRNILKRFFVGLKEMGDFVEKNGKSNGTADQMKLFEPQSKYQPNSSKDDGFDFFADSRFFDEALRIFIEYKEKK